MREIVAHSSSFLACLCEAGNGVGHVLLLLGDGRQTQEFAPILDGLGQHALIVIDARTVGAMLGHESLIHAQRREVDEEGTHGSLGLASAAAGPLEGGPACSPIRGHRDLARNKPPGTHVRDESNADLLGFLPGQNNERDRPDHEGWNFDPEIDQEEVLTQERRGSVPYEVDDHREEPEHQDNAGLGPAALELDERQREADTRHRGRHGVHEGAGDSTHNEGKQETAVSGIIDPEEVQDVLGKHESTGRKTRVDDAINNRIDVGSTHDDDDENTQPLEGLFDEWGDKGSGECSFL